jgi:type III restriction enzyme
MIQRLLAVESTEEPTEIVIHVNMLKEGWDVTNLYTIVPLRAANARILIEQSIGRGLRLPYGKRTGVMAVDRLNIVAHDKFQEIVDEAKKPGSTIQLQQIVLTGEQLGEKTVTVVSQPQLASQLGIQPTQITTSTVVAPTNAVPAFTSASEQQVAQIAYEVIRRLESQPQTAPSVSYLQHPEVQARVAKEVASQIRPDQLQLPGVEAAVDIAAVVAKTAEMVIQQTIDIPRILVVPKGEVRSGYRPFTLQLSAMNYQPPSDDLWAQHLRTGEVEVLSMGRGGIEEVRLEDYVVSGLVDYDDVSYDDHAELLYDLASQVVKHLQSYLSEDDTRKVLRCFQTPISQFVHAQMQEYYWEEATGYEVKVSKGFTELKPCAFTASATETVRDFRQAPSDKSNMAKYVFGGFQRCLYPALKFQSDSERKLSVICDRESLKWFKPAKGQFQIFYLSNGEHLEYQPDFVAEIDDIILMLEPKATSAMDDADVLAKRDAAVKWCKQASDHSNTCGGKPWQYVLIPHDVIAENMTLRGLAQQYGVKFEVLAQGNTGVGL